MLFEPIRFRNIELPNRIVMSPMCMYSCKEGVVNNFHFTHYTSRAYGGTGLIIVEGTSVSPQGMISPEDVGLWNDEQAEALSKIVKHIHDHTETKVGIQLAHAGRKAGTRNGEQLALEDGGWETLAPSPIPYKPEERVPHELTKEEITEIAQQFAAAARRAVNAGFDLVEIHAAHGYLLHEFLSPVSNERTDEYGGSLENRSRFLMEVTAAVRKIIGEGRPLFVRISADEYAENGWDLNQSIELCKSLKTAGVDLIDVSSGGNIHGARINVFNGYQVPFAAEIKKQVGISVGAVGLITAPQQAEEILQNAEADLIFLGRELLRNPYFAVQASFAMKEPCFFPRQYERGRPRQ